MQTCNVTNINNKKYVAILEYQPHQRRANEYNHQISMFI